MIRFLVIYYSSAYNAILGHTTLNSMKAITTTYHLMVKFLMKNGVGEQKEDQVTTHKCYVATLK